MIGVLPGAGGVRPDPGGGTDRGVDGGLGPRAVARVVGAGAGGVPASDRARPVARKRELPGESARRGGHVLHLLPGLGVRLC